MVVGPVPEHRENGGVIDCRRHSEPAELPQILHEGEISAGQGNDTSGSFHAAGGKRGNKKRENKRGEGRHLLLLGLVFCHTSQGARSEETRRTFNNPLLKRTQGTWNTGVRQTIPDIRHGENQGLRILGNQTRRTETGEEKSNTDGD